MHRSLSLSLSYCLVAMGALHAQIPYQADFNPPTFNLGSVHQQNGWQVQQGIAEIQGKAGREGTQGLVIVPSNPFGQASLILDEPSKEPVVFIDLWLRPISSATEEEAQFIDADGVVAGFFRIDQKGQL